MRSHFNEPAVMTGQRARSGELSKQYAREQVRMTRREAIARQARLDIAQGNTVDTSE